MNTLNNSTPQDEMTNEPSVAVASELPVNEQEAFLEEVGTIIFKSTVTQFLTTVSDDEAKAFEAFVEEHVGSENFIDEITIEYPEFRLLLEEEMEAFQKELS